MLKKIIQLALIPAVILLAAELPATSNRLQTVLKSGELRVATSGDHPPLTSYTPSLLSYRGFDIDLVKELASDLGVRLTLIPVLRQNMTEGMLQGRFDMATGVIANLEMAKRVGFSDSYLTVNIVPIISREKKRQLTDWNKINQQGVNVTVIQGTVLELRARSFFPDANILPLQGKKRECSELTNGEADVYLTTHLEASSILAECPQLTTVEEGMPAQINRIGIMLPQSDQNWINYINLWLETKRAEGFINQLEMKWLMNTSTPTN